MNLLSLHPFRDCDVSKMEAWLEKDYIKKWYREPEDWLTEVRGRNGEFSFIRHFILYYEEQPIGFCQYYPCADAEEDWYGDLPLEGTYSIDYLIGEEEYLGKGLGKAAIRALTEKIFSLSDAERIIVQPEPDNQPSCKSLLTNGYQFDTGRNFFIKYK